MSVNEYTYTGTFKLIIHEDEKHASIDFLFDEDQAAPKKRLEEWMWYIYSNQILWESHMMSPGNEMFWTTVIRSLYNRLLPKCNCGMEDCIRVR